MRPSVARLLLARALGLCMGGAASAWLIPSLREGNLIYWLVGLFAGPIALLWVARAIPLVARIASESSALISMAGWSVLITFALGLESPLVAALFVEIGLAAAAIRPSGVGRVTLYAVLALAVVHLIYGFSQGWPLFLLEVFFVAAMGGLGCLVASRRVAGERAYQTQGAQLGRRLDALQRELEDERVISRVGENVARLAHGLKNAVHSLRGFVSLIEPRLEGTSGSEAALAGLRAAIDDLEKLARLTLSEGSTGEAGVPHVPEISRPASVADTSDFASPSEAAREALEEIQTASPGVDWVLEVDDAVEGLRVPVAHTTLLELVVIVMRNAVEAMEGTGAGQVEVGVASDRCSIRVSDEGPGFSEEDIAKGLEPGYTTKAQGSGFGLFLARRIVESQGGRLEISSRPPADGTSGAVVHVELPTVPQGESAGDARDKDG